MKKLNRMSKVTNDDGEIEFRMPCTIVSVSETNSKGEPHVNTNDTPYLKLVVEWLNAKGIDKTSTAISYNMDGLETFEDAIESKDELLLVSSKDEEGTWYLNVAPLVFTENDLDDDDFDLEDETPSPKAKATPKKKEPVQEEEEEPSREEMITKLVADKHSTKRKLNKLDEEALEDLFYDTYPELEVNA